MQSLNHPKINALGIVVCFFIVTDLIVSCAALPPRRAETRVEKVEREKILGIELANQIENGLKIRRDKELEIYLRNLVLALVHKHATLEESAAGVILMGPVGGKWKNFALPGNRTYLSVELLKTLTLESEFAAVIALQLGHLSQGHLLSRIFNQRADAGEVKAVPVDAQAFPSTLPRQIDFFGPAGVFDFDEKELYQAIDSAVPLLYDNGYDPRGLFSVWKSYIRHPAKSPYDEILVTHAIEHTRDALAKKPPLRNPVLNSERFDSVLERMRKL